MPKTSTAILVYSIRHNIFVRVTCHYQGSGIPQQVGTYIVCASAAAAAGTAGRAGTSTPPLSQPSPIVYRGLGIQYKKRACTHTNTNKRTRTNYDNDAIPRRRSSVEENTPYRYNNNNNIVRMVIL